MKSIYVAGTAAAVVGVPAVGYGAWTLSSGKGSSNRPTTNIPGYLQNKPTASGLGAQQATNLSSLVGNHEEVDFRFQIGGCFRNFFPGVSVTFPAHTSTAFTPSDGKWDVVSTTNAAPDSQGKAVGCVAMQMKQAPEEGDYYVFKSELTVKNGSIGFSIQTGLGFQKGLKPHILKEYINFLEKKNDKWEVAGGLFFYKNASGAGSESHTVENFRPGDEGDWFTDPKDREYLGFWMEDDSASNAQEVLKDVRIKMPQANTTPITSDLLSGGWGNRTSLEAENPASALYKDSQWLHLTHSNKNNTNLQAAKTAFETFYKPFKDKRGVWKKQTDLDPECSRLYSKQDLKETDADFKKYSDFCYAKQT